jgi:hypothetical protein
MPWVVEEGGITVLYVRLARGSLAFASALLIGAGCWTQRNRLSGDVEPSVSDVLYGYGGAASLFKASST